MEKGRGMKATGASVVRYLIYRGYRSSVGVLK